MNNIEIVSHPLGGRWDILCGKERVGAWTDILARYLERKGALEDHISAQTRIYKVHFPLLRWDPLWLTKDNQVGVNTIVLFGKNNY